MTEKLYLITEAQRNSLLNLNYASASELLQSLPVVSSEPFAYYLQETDNVDFIYAHEYSNHEDRMHERGGEVTPLYTSPQAPVFVDSQPVAYLSYYHLDPTMHTEADQGFEVVDSMVKDAFPVYISPPNPNTQRAFR